MRRSFGAAALIAAVLAAVFASAASADLVGPITFESPAYSAGDINGQQGWSKTGPYDVAVAQPSMLQNYDQKLFQGCIRRHLGGRLERDTNRGGCREYRPNGGAIPTGFQ